MNKKIFQFDGGTTYSAATELKMLEKFLPKYNLSICEKFLKKIRPYDAICDFGAGLGTLANIVQKNTGIQPVCVEIDLTLRQELKSRGFSTLNSLEKSEKQFDVIYSSNVLEHIQDDEATLRELNAHLKLGGKLLLYLPAFETLYTQMDEDVGHYRRYEKRLLWNKLYLSGYKVIEMQYCDSLGFIITFLMKLLRVNPSAHVQNEISLKFYDKFVLPFSKFFDFIGFKYIFGKNIFVFSVKVET